MPFDGDVTEQPADLQVGFESHSEQNERKAKAAEPRLSEHVAEHLFAESVVVAERQQRQRRLPKQV